MRKLNPEYTVREVALFLSWVIALGFTAGGRNLAREMKISISPIRQRRKASAGLLKFALHREKVLTQYSCWNLFSSIVTLLHTSLSTDGCVLCVSPQHCGTKVIFCGFSLVNRPKQKNSILDYTCLSLGLFKLKLI